MITIKGKNFFMMFDVVEGGIVEPIEFDKENLVPEKSIIVMDESRQTVWLWHGKRRGLVPRRTALRQAQSLKGHGYQAGNAIIGRDLNQIVEIDDRKVGREPETTELFKSFEPVINGYYEHIGNLVYIVTDTPPKETPKQESIPEPEKPVKEDIPTPPSEPKLPPEVPSKSIQIEERPVLRHIPEEAPEVKSSDIPDILIKGAVIMAVGSEFKDIWISQKPDDSISLEHMDGKICSFKVIEGKVNYLEGSFSEVSEEKRAAIEKKLDSILNKE